MSGLGCMLTDLLIGLKRRIVALNVEDRLIAAVADFASLAGRKKNVLV